MGTNKQRHIRRTAGLITLCVLAVSCGGGSDDATADVTVPVTDAVAAPATEVATTVAPATTAAPVEEVVVDIPTLPCAEYVAEVGYPLKPCDSGVLVESLQRDLEPLFAGIGIDGLFGQQTFGFIEEYQAANGLEVTGVVTEELANAIAESDGIELADDTTETEATETETEATETETEATETDATDEADS